MFICTKHRRQLDLYGDIKTRTKFDKNNFIYNENFAEIELYNIKNEVVAKVKIDLEDVVLVSQYKWHLNKGYAYTKRDNKILKMHILIMNSYRNNTNLELEIDHINRDKCDNRKNNLRFVTHKENMQNLSQSKRNLTNEKGIYFVKSRNKYRFEYLECGKKKSKYFNNLCEAIDFKNGIQ